ncbi:LacI family DNA-binding transcriptional regulator [Arenimonas sp. GDDSR-1]|uniref:LacI family DNA-binding transcriptional regulator n=1 Tax=Arenimonas sp. GDDSR-1 TaxID=2950125 RepID=UPI002619487F|nr:LacI family DNA-binding transcriptional regulator [Arenimonas sp. GDDSR-1]
MKSKTTSFDIAYRAGVSQSTVSRALRNSPLVNEETRKRIQAIAKEMHYTVDKNASNLRSQHSDTLAVLLFEDPTSDDSQINPFFLSMIGSITRACSQYGYDLLISFQQASNDWHADFEDSRKADGIILLGYGDYLDYAHRLNKLVEQGTHFVRWGPVLPVQPGITVGCDNYLAGREMTEHLLLQGHRRIAFLGHASERYPEFFERYRGYAEALAQAGITPDAALQIDAITTEQAGHEAMQALLAQGRVCDAVFGASDLIAIGAMRAIQEHGLKVPEDIAVAGFDNIPMANFVSPGLTTVLQDTKQAGELLVKTLIHQINNEPVSSCMLPAKLVIRRSCGALSQPEADPAP